MGFRLVTSYVFRSCRDVAVIPVEVRACDGRY